MSATSWSARERALLSGCIRSRQIRDQESPRFIHASKLSAENGDFVQDLLARAPQSVNERVRATLANLGLVGRGLYGQWMRLDREADLSLAYATDIDEADLVFRDLKDTGLIGYELLLNEIHIQITLPGWRLIEQMHHDAAANSEKSESTIVAADTQAALGKVVDEEASAVKGRVTFGIITDRDDEFRAVLQRFQIVDQSEGKRDSTNTP